MEQVQLQRQRRRQLRRGRARPRTVAARDSKDPHGPVLTMEPTEWREFIAEVKAGRHDLA
ncbi:MAG TPA: DUF397 domain-containing protein [Streptosporangiaceae bacterium]|nr:DUF397 domain-containing protein [Streptosporangiaceae bacterium]